MGRSPTSRWAEAAGLALVVGLGAWLRWRTLGADALSLDEGATLQLARLPLARLWTEPVDPTPPLYYTVMKAVGSAGVDLERMRALSLVAGLLTIPVLWWAARRLAGPVAGLVAAAVLAVHGPHVEWSQEARAYALLVLLAALATAALAAALTSSARWPLALWGAASVAGLYTHHTAAVWVAAGALALLADAPTRPVAERGGRLRALGVLGAAMAVLAVPWALMLWRAVAAGQASWIPPADLSRAVWLLRQTVGLRGLPALQPWADLALAGLGVAGALLALRRRATAFALVPLAVVPPALWAAGAVTPVLLVRSLLVVGLAAAFAWALVVARLPRAAGAVIAAGLVGLHLASTLGWEAAGRTETADWPGAAARLAALDPPPRLLVLCRHETQAMLAHHWQAGPMPPAVLPVRDMPAFLPAEADPAHRAGFVAVARAIAAPEGELAARLGPFGREAAMAALAVARSAGGAVAVRANCPAGSPPARRLDALISGAGLASAPLWSGKGIAIDRLRPLR